MLPLASRELQGTAPPRYTAASLATAGRQVEAVFLRACHIYPHRDRTASIALAFVFPVCRCVAVVL